MLMIALPQDTENNTKMPPQHITRKSKLSTKTKDVNENLDNKVKQKVDNNKLVLSNKTKEHENYNQKEMSHLENLLFLTYSVIRFRVTTLFVAIKVRKDSLFCLCLVMKI